MVNYGADGIFQVGDSLEDKDIDILIQEGEERAMNIYKKANQAATDKLNLADFTMNSMNLYQFEDVDYAKKRRIEEQDKVMEQIREMIIQDVTRGRRKAQLKSNLSESTLCPKIF